MIAGLNRLILNCASILTGNFLNKILSVAVLVYLTGYLSPAEFGRYSFVIAYIAFFGILTDLGLNTLMTREIAGQKVDSSLWFGHAIAIRLLSTLLTVSVSLVCLAAAGYSYDIVNLASAASLSLLFSFRGLFFRTVFDIPFQVRLKMNYPAAVNFINELLSFAVLVMLIKNGSTLFEIVLALNIVNIPSFLVMAYLAVKEIRPSFSFDPKAWRAIIKDSLPLGLASLLEGVFIIIPVFLLSKYSTEEALGFYSLPFRISASLWIIPVAVMVTLLPRMSRDAITSAPTVREGFTRGFKVMLLIGVPMALVTDYYAEPIISAFTSNSYTGSVSALSVMIWGTFMYFINTVFYYTFTAAGKQRLNTLVWLAQSAVCFVLSVLLIPAHAHMGAAIAFTVSLAAGFGLNVFFAYRSLGINIVPVTKRFAISGALCAAVFFMIPDVTMMAAPLGVGSYLTALFSMRAVSVREWGEWLNRPDAEK